jgi:predicted aldo/keto reductase-like oxidoreductase
MNIDAYLDEKFGIYDYLIEQKKTGRIRHLGFSAHGSYDIIKRFLEYYGSMMEFGMIQLNYLDWNFQDAKAKADLLSEFNIPIWVMEPLRGGQLASLADEDAKKLKTLRADEKIPAWAFRFIQSMPNIVITLTGVSTIEQLQENIETYQEEKPLNQNELDALMSIAEYMVMQTNVPCTECNYCLNHCPQHLEIPKLLKLYNEHCFTISKGGFGFIAPMALMALPEEKHPKACIACRSCETVCPQKIIISDALNDFAAKFN